MYRVLVHPVAGRLLLLATGLGLFLIGLGWPSFWDPDEGRHAEIAREALVSGNWLTPSFDFAPYHDKPMFIYWLVGGCFRLFGLHEWAARLPSALAAIATLWLTAWWGRRYFGPPVGRLAALMLATAGMYVAVGRFVLIDMTFCLWMSATLFAAGAWFLEGGERGWPFWPIYVPMAIATLVKGPAAIVLSGLVLAVPAYRAGMLRRWRELQLGHGLLLIGLIAGSWYVAAAIRSPDYVLDFLWHHNVGRFASAETGHRMNPFVYLYFLPLTFLPWSTLLPVAVCRANRPDEARAVLAWQYCLLWVGVIFVFFSLSQAKLATYMLPLFPPLALLLAVALDPLVRGERPPRAVESALRLGYGLIGVLALIAPLVTLIVLSMQAPTAMPRALVLCLVWPFVYWGWRALRRLRHDQVLACLFGLSVVAYLGFYTALAPALNQQLSLKGAAQQLAQLPRDTPITAFRALKNSLVFYAERPVRVVDDPEAAGVALAGATPAALLSKRRVLDELRCHLRGDVYVWWQGQGDKLLLVNRRPDGESSEIEVVSPRTCAGEVSPGDAKGS